MNQTMASYYNPAAAAYGPLSAASMAAAAAAAQQSAAMSAGLGAPPQVNTVLASKKLFSNCKNLLRISIFN